jgi:hypothetical protein
LQPLPLHHACVVFAVAFALLNPMRGDEKMATAAAEDIYAADRQRLIELCDLLKQVTL